MPPVILNPEEMPPSVAAHLMTLDEDKRTHWIVHTLADAVEEAERMENEWWHSLTPAQQEAERHGLLQSIANADAGRVSPGNEVFVRIRARHAGCSESIGVQEEPELFWSELSPEQQEKAESSILRAFADQEAGRVYPLNTLVERVRARVAVKE